MTNSSPQPREGTTQGHESQEAAEITEGRLRSCPSDQPQQNPCCLLSTPQRRTGTHVHTRTHTHLPRVNFTRVQKKKAQVLGPLGLKQMFLCPRCWVDFQGGARSVSSEPPQLIADIHLLLSQASLPPPPRQRFRMSGVCSPAPTEGKFTASREPGLTWGLECIFFPFASALLG